MIKNQQPIEKRVRRSDGKLEVHSIFHTIQGEGPFSGQRAVFVRLAGCNLQCPLCDTDYTSNREVMSPDEIIAGARMCSENTKLMIITGGEPFRQQLVGLFKAAVYAGYAVQVETNGTLEPDNYSAYRVHTTRLLSGVYIVVSPKSGKLNEAVVARACAFKYVGRAGQISTDDSLPTVALDHSANPRLARPPKWWDRPIYYQPCDEQDATANLANLEAVRDACLRHGYTFQLQIHKLAGLS